MRAAHDASTADPGEAAAGLPGEAAAGLPGEAAAGLPGEAAAGLPGEAAAGLPGESAAGLPGETPAGLPGSTFACPGIPASGQAACTMAVNTNVPPVANAALPAAAIPGLHPADLQSAYGLPSQNAGGTVAVVDAFDDPTAESDLAVYRAAFGLPACTSTNGCFRKVDQRGQTGAYPATNVAWAQETALDLEMVSAACPRCSILLVEADSASLDDLGAGVDTAAAYGAAAISNSYYAIEWKTESNEDVHYRHNGIAVTASSGDRGYPSYPAASRYVTAVGGTTLTGGPGNWTEAPWKYTGHGCSAMIWRPRWQPGPCRGRSAVDMAAIADPQTGVATFSTQGGGWFVAGGTSVGAPLVAAAYALSGVPAGPWFSYARPTGFHPIGGGGYQPITGLGSPNGVVAL
ncbi:MAG: peptidase S8 [Candidatus Eremiobacteraeota bacterium]|nr:peptidase S8 [Candidatus Eremiobacteraeota bacterium]